MQLMTEYVILSSCLTIEAYGDLGIGEGGNRKPLLRSLSTSRKWGNAFWVPGTLVVGGVLLKTVSILRFLSFPVGVSGKQVETKPSFHVIPFWGHYVMVFIAGPMLSLCWERSSIGAPTVDISFLWTSPGWQCGETGRVKL